MLHQLLPNVRVLGPRSRIDSASASPECCQWSGSPSQRRDNRQNRANQTSVHGRSQLPLADIHPSASKASWWCTVVYCSIATPPRNSSRASAKRFNSCWLLGTPNDLGHALQWDLSHPARPQRNAKSDASTE